MTRPPTSRDLVRALSFEDTRLLAEAALAMAGALNRVDSLRPDPANRADARRLVTLSDRLFGANQARDFIEGEENS